ncbi:MAG: SDR family NAD(P)-dependent oxidoreductase [Pseudomonadota bacterium]
MTSARPRRFAFFAPMNPPLEDWAGKRVWIVGASTGIGLATAQALHAAGATVYVSARKAQALGEFVSTHPGSIAIPLDVCDREAVRTGALQALQAGPLDLVMYCAGLYRPMQAMNFDLDEMVKHQETNYVGALNVLDAVLPSIIKAGHGHLSLVSSVAGYRGLPKSLAYGPTKAALIHLAEVLHLDLQPRGIGVSVVNPGFVDTPLTAQNDFKMPALITTAQAAHLILKGWADGKFEIHFPARFTWTLKLLAMLPFRVYRALVRKGTGL